nr:WYL domain-containing protein [Saprospiraceae bacterium]
IKPSLQAFVTAKENEISNHFNYLFGVTIFDGISPQKVVFKTTTQLSKYMDTKPIHPTQIKSLMEGKNDVYYELNVYINYEIISKLLSFGDDLEVMSPPSLRAEMRAKVLKMAAKYADS